MQSPQTPNPVPTNNTIAQDVVTVVEDAIEQGEAVIEIALIAQVPLLGTPVLKQIWEALFDYLVKLVMRPVATLGGRVVITVEEYAALQDAARAQAALDAAKLSGDPDAIAKASSQVDQSVAHVIHYIGAFKP